MRRKLPVVLLIFAVLLGLFGLIWRQAAQTRAENAKTFWQLRQTLLADWCHQTPENDCLKSVVPQHRLTVVVFSATWCGPCRNYEGKTLADPTVRAALDPLGRVVVDIDANKLLSDEYEIKYVPTTLLLDAQGRVLARHVGGMSKDDFLKWLRPHL